MEGRLTLSNSLLAVAIRHRVGAVSLDVKFCLTQPWTVLFGPSGSGKTTVLRAIAGFVRPDAGRIEFATEVFFDSSERVFVPPHRRAVRTAGQMARLFPHMTVMSNIAYGSGWNLKPDDVRGVVEEVMVSFRLRNLGDRMPSDLSGGERQRASVARALVSAITFDGTGKPLLLLDEPLSGLDVATRDELVAELRQWTTRWNVPVLSVTHDLGEAFQLEAEVVKIADGRVARQGPVDEVLIEERLQLLKRLRG
ncbi:MAG: ABC transporter [Acidobacteria bacterium]|nr:MAG: ABC transporter [Acidobacteriota bacterium]